MTQITIDLPKELEFMKDLPSAYWIAVLQKMLKEKSSEIEKLIRLKKTIDEKSQLTEKDVKDLTDKINEAMWRRHKKYGATHS